MSDNIQLLLDDCRGIYIPRDAAEFLADPRWVGFQNDDLATIENPDHEWYWDAWDSIVQSAEFKDSDGVTWRLYQDGALFAISENATDAELSEAFGW